MSKYFVQKTNKISSLNKTYERNVNAIKHKMLQLQEIHSMKCESMQSYSSHLIEVQSVCKVLDDTHLMQKFCDTDLGKFKVIQGQS